jgi:hypothetical protein
MCELHEKNRNARRSYKILRKVRVVAAVAAKGGGRKKWRWIEKSRKREGAGASSRSGGGLTSCARDRVVEVLPHRAVSDAAVCVFWEKGEDKHLSVQLLVVSKGTGGTWTMRVVCMS